MYFCNAFHENHSPCSIPVTTERGVCPGHHDFYKDVWISRYPLNMDGENDFFFSSSEKLKNVYKKAILEGYVKITQAHFQDLVYSGKPVSSFVDYYLLCCLQPGVDPLWHFRLFNETVTEIANCHTRSVFPLVKNDKTILYRFLDPLFNTTMREFDAIFYYMVNRLCAGYYTPSKTPIHIDDPSVSLLQYFQDHPKFKREFLWKHSIYNENSISLISSRKDEPVPKKILSFIFDLPEKRKACYESQKLAFKEKAEEIVQVTWAPERFMKWCVDVEEGKELNERWPLIV